MAKQRPQDFYHLYYEDMMKEPLGALKKVYSWLGDEWTAETEQGMNAWLAANPQNRFGRHSYSLEQWGFTRKDLEPYFSDYLKEHPVATGKEA